MRHRLETNPFEPPIASLQKVCGSWHAAAAARRNRTLLVSGTSIHAPTDYHKSFAALANTNNTGGLHLPQSFKADAKHAADND